MTLNLTGRFYRQSATERSEAVEDVSIEPSEAAFVLIDVYGRGYDDTPPPEVLWFYETNPVWREIVRNRIVPARQAARLAGLPVIYVTNALSDGMNERSQWRNMGIRTTGIDVLECWPEPNDILAFSNIIAPQPRDLVIRKQMYSGFFETTLDSTLRSQGVRDLVVVGFDSRICLANTVTDAMYRGYRVIVLRDCIQTTEEPETADSGLCNFLAIRYIETNVGYTATSADFIAACDRATQPAS